ncbi:hypothetical protein AB5I41_29315 [Sphingomonas sp. MMS24-JH45]
MAQHRAGHRDPIDLRRRLPRRDRGRFPVSARLARQGAARPRRRVPVRARRGRGGERPARSGARGGQGRTLRPSGSHGEDRRDQPRSSGRRSAARWRRDRLDAVDGESGGATGRSYADAPEIDGEVFLRDARHLSVGDIVGVTIEDADKHDLYGVPVQLPR